MTRPEISRRKRESSLGHAALEADTLTTWPRKRSEQTGILGAGAQAPYPMYRFALAGLPHKTKVGEEE